MPQSCVPPQPSPCMPQLKPSCPQVLAVQPPEQTPGIPPPPHTWPIGHMPQSCIPSQPSVCRPQLKPSCMQLFLVQVGTSGETHEVRSNSMNSSSFSCAV